MCIYTCHRLRFLYKHTKNTYTQIGKQRLIFFLGEKKMHEW